MELLIQILGNCLVMDFYSNNAYLSGAIRNLSGKMGIER